MTNQIDPDDLIDLTEELANDVAHMVLKYPENEIKKIRSLASDARQICKLARSSRDMNKEFFKKFGPLNPAEKS